MTTIAFDTETHGLDWFDGETAFLASWADADSEYVADLSDPDEAQRFENALSAADTLVCHNLAFDVHQTRETTGVDVLRNGATLHDTDLMARCVHPVGAGSFGAFRLKNLGKTLLRQDAQDAEEAIKEMGKSIGLKTMKQSGAYYDVWRAYPDVMEQYAKEDARLTYDLYSRMSGELNGYSRAYELEMAVAPVLIRAEQRGVAIDQEAAQELLTEYGAMEKQLHESLLRDLNMDALDGEGSQEALLNALEELGVPLYRKTDTGKLKTDKFALQEFEDDFPVLADLQEWRRVSKFLSTYIGPMVGREVVHTSFRQCEAWTGRMSSARPNLQNLPKAAGSEVRRPIVARPGHKLVVSDFDGIEARLLAWYMNDENYRRMFREGLDPHAWMAAQIHGGTMEDFAKGGPNDDKRSAAKNTLFAITYGAGAPRVADMNKISKAEAKALISQIKNSLPKYRKLMGRIRKKVTIQGSVNTLWGRRQVINKEKAYVGLNALIQGSAAEIMKQALVNVDKVVSEYGAQPLLVVHDEVVTEAPEECAKRVQEVQEQAMREAYELDPPLEVSGSITDNYANA